MDREVKNAIGVIIASRASLLMIILSENASKRRRHTLRLFDRRQARIWK